MKSIALTARNTSTTSMTNTIIVFFILAAAFCIGSMCYGLYVRKVPLSKYILTSRNPLVLFFIWPFHLLKFVCWGVNKVRGKQIKVPDAEIQQKPQRSAIIQLNCLDRDLVEAFNIEQTPAPSPTYSIWNRPAYVPVAHPSLSSSPSEIQAARHMYVPLSHFASPEVHAYNDCHSNSQLSAYNFPTYSPYAASEGNVVGGENAAYFQAGPSNSQIMRAAFASAKEVERVRMEVDKIEAERIRKEASESSLGSASVSATKDPNAQKTSNEDMSHVYPLVPSTACLFSVGTGQPEFVHPVSRPVSVTGFTLQCSDGDSTDGEEEETLESKQAETEAAQRFQHHADLQELKEARYQADIGAAVADLRKKLEPQMILDTNTAFMSMGTESETPVTDLSNSSSSSEFPFRSGSVLTFAAALRDWEAEEAEEEEQVLLDPIRASVMEMFKKLPVQRPKGWKGASLVPAESLLKITTEFDVAFGSSIDPGPNGFGTLVESPKHYVSGEQEAPVRIQVEAEGAQPCQPVVDLEFLAEALIDAEVDVAPVDVEMATLERDLKTQSTRHSSVDMFQTAPIQHFRGANTISLDSQESLSGITMNFNVEFRFSPVIASPAISNREDSSLGEDTLDLPFILGPDVEFKSTGGLSGTSLMDLVSPIEPTSRSSSTSDFVDACREWDAEEALSAAVLKMLDTNDNDEVAPYTQLASTTNTPSTNSAYLSMGTVSADPVAGVPFPSVDNFLPLIGDVFDTATTPNITTLSSAASDVANAWETEIELRESIMDMFANNPIQHLQGQGASVVSASPASSSSFETYLGAASPAPSSSFETYPGGRSNLSPAFEDPFGDFSEVCFAARFLPENRGTSAEMNELCERAAEEDETGKEDVPGELETQEATSAAETEEIESTPIMRETPEAEDFLAAALPFFRIQHEFSAFKPKPLKSMLQHWELRANAQHVPGQRFVPDWKFEKDMAR
jgi:hypothetical protein